MTVIMAYSIYAVRISSDIPVQSNYIPVIKFFFILSNIWNLLAMVWFVLLNNFKSKEYVPKVFNSLGGILQKIICFCSHKRKRDPILVLRKDKKVADNNEAINVNSLEQNQKLKCRFCSNEKNMEISDKLELKKILVSNYEIINKLFFILFIIISVVTILLTFS